MLQLNNEIKYSKSLLFIKIRVYIGIEWLRMIMTIRDSAKVHQKRGFARTQHKFGKLFLCYDLFFNKIRVRNRFWIVIIILRHSYSPLANRVLEKCCVRKFIADYFCIYFFCTVNHDKKERIFSFICEEQRKYTSRNTKTITQQEKMC